MDRVFVGVGNSLGQAFKSNRRLFFLFGLLAISAELEAQVVTPKTLPVLQSGQFEMYPSSRAGMGGATIAADDTLLDPFVNPAKTTRIGTGYVSASPYYHSISGSRGGGRSLPVGGGGSWGAWSAAGLFTFQQLDRAGPTWNLSTSDESAVNQYASGSIARRLSSTASIGLGIQLAALDAMDGVDLLYGGSDRIVQSGSLAEFRTGFTKETAPGRQLEMVLVHARTDMRHDVRFTSWRWDPVAKVNIQTQRNERNEDRTRIWGLHSEYSRPVGAEGWRLGWLGTVNRLSHPKIPNYVIQNIPRDPGTTYSFNAGVGIGRKLRESSFAADLIYEPIFADTWATAANDTAIVTGGSIAAGAKTVENTFRFSNVKLRLGVGRDDAIGKSGNVFGFQVGLALHAINYRLQQTNNVQNTFRTQREDWVEWTPTAGLRLRSHDLDVMYNFSLTCGAGRCGEGANMPIAVPDVGGISNGGIIAAPSSQLFMQSGALQVHKLTFSLPIR